MVVSREQPAVLIFHQENMGSTKVASSGRAVDGMASHRVLAVSVLLLALCLNCMAADVLISSSGREPTITAAVPIDVLGNDSIAGLSDADWCNWQYRPWVFSALGSALVSLSGVFPLVLMPLGYDCVDTKGDQGGTLRVMLSFAVGGLLGDVFLHLLPEAWGALPSTGNSSTTEEYSISRGNGQHIRTGMWVLVGMLVFIIVEKCCSGEQEKEESPVEEVRPAQKIKEELANTLNNNIHEGDGNDRLSVFQEDKGNVVEEQNHSPKVNPSPPKKVAGYLNLVANSIDNFTHGLAVGGGFSLSLRVGVFTTLAILVHEVPHEIGDFAILMRSGFSRWDAARAQLLTGSAGVLGALAASFGAAVPGETGVSWVLPFTAGGFLHIALVSVLPELASESDPRESVKQLVGLVVGILLMAALTTIMES